jgi:hypothetical protein
VRLTVRRLMAAVALAAVVMGVAREARRLSILSREYRRKALLSAREERQWRQGLAKRREYEAEAWRLAAALRPRDRELAEWWAREASERAEGVAVVRATLAHHAVLRRKYEHAASRPWEPVAPDPPEPREPAFRGCVQPPKEPLPPGQRWYSAAEDAARLRETSLPR